MKMTIEVEGKQITQEQISKMIFDAFPDAKFDKASRGSILGITSDGTFVTVTIDATADELC